MGKHAHAIDRPWFWETGLFAVAWKGMDWPSVRRGRQVYTEVFAPCHSLIYMNFLQFQQFMTKEEIKKLASSYDLIDDLADDDGTPLVRPGKMTDDLPMPYPNSQTAKFANGGAAPPDLTQGFEAYVGNGNYIFALLTGYNWGNGEIGLDIPSFAPKVGTGKFWNPYFPGCIISMPPPLSDGILEFEDGTPATVCQMAKDVVNFLKWTSEPMYDDKRVMYVKGQATVFVFMAWAFYQQQRLGNFMTYKRSTFRYWKKPW